MNTMTYKGYTARVEYDERDNLFVGRVLGIRNIISFHGETVAQLRAEFELAVKDYLADCKEQGIHPEKPASGKLLLRMQSDAHRRAVTALPQNAELTTQEVADYLNVSLPYVEKLIEEEKLPARKVGTRRRVAFQDLLRFDEQQRARQCAALDELARIDAELGL